METRAKKEDAKWGKLISAYSYHRDKISNQKYTQSVLVQEVVPVEVAVHAPGKSVERNIIIHK